MRVFEWVLSLGTFLLAIGFSTPCPLNAAEKGMSEISEKVSTPADYQRLYFSYFGMYQGPSVANPGGRGSIDTSTLTYEEGQQNLQSQFKLDYYLSPHLFVGPVLNFQINPIAANSNFFMLDSGIRIGHTRIMHTANVNLLADFRITGPMKPENRRNDEIVDLQSLQVLTYKVPKTKLTLGIVGFHTLQLYGEARPVKSLDDLSAAKDWNLFFGPYVSYELSSTVSAVVSYDLHPYHRVGAKWDTWTSDPSDLSPGISWDITGDINLQTQFLIYPSQLRWDTVGTAAYLTVQFI